MREIIMIMSLVLLTNANSLLAQEVCESNEEELEDLNSITKCTIDKTEKTDASGNKTKKLSVKISTSARFLKRRVKKEEVSGLASVSSSGIKNTASKSEISNSLSLKEKSNKFDKIREKISKEQLKNAFEFGSVDQIPLFKSCENKNKAENSNCFNEKMMAHIQKHFEYPKEAMINKIQGNVWVRFIIDEEGNVTNLKTLSPKNGKVLKEEAERVISMLPSFKPAIKGSKKVLTKYGFPINFSLED